MGEICAECGAAGPWRNRGLQWCDEHKSGVWDPHRDEGMARNKVDSEPTAEPVKAKPVKAKPVKAEPKKAEAPTVQAPAAQTVQAQEAEPTELIEPVTESADDDAAMCFVAPQCAFDLQTALEEAQSQCDRLKSDLAAAKDSKAEVWSNLLEAYAQRDKLRDERDKISQEWNRAHEQMRAAQAQADTIQLQADALKAERDALMTERDALKAALSNALAALPGPQAQQATPDQRAERDDLKAEGDALKAELEALRDDRDRFKAELAAEQVKAGRWRQQAQESLMILSDVQAVTGGSIGELHDAARRIKEKIAYYRDQARRLARQVEELGG